MHVDDYSTLKVHKSLAFGHKLDVIAVKHVLICYAEDVTGYKLWKSELSEGSRNIIR
jgi:hypothetical protein